MHPRQALEPHPSVSLQSWWLLFTSTILTPFVLSDLVYCLFWCFLFLILLKTKVSLLLSSLFLLSGGSYLSTSLEVLPQGRWNLYHCIYLLKNSKLFFFISKYLLLFLHEQSLNIVILLASLSLTEIPFTRYQKRFFFISSFPSWLTCYSLLNKPCTFFFYNFTQICLLIPIFIATSLTKILTYFLNW
jgi:hypothetical protein